MTEQVKTSVVEKPTVSIQAAAKTDDKQPKGKVISHPRDVAALVLMEINQVNAKKDELTLVIKRLTDLTQQLATSYGKQMMVIEQLARRVNSLEGKGPEDKDKKKVNGQVAA